MAQRKIHEMTGTAAECEALRIVKIYWDSEWSEFVCKVWDDGKRRETADHFTDSREDAFGTAKAMFAPSTWTLG